MTIKEWIALVLSIIIMVALLVLCDILIAFIPYVILIVVKHEIAKLVADWIFFLLLIPELISLFCIAIFILDQRSEK